MTVVCGAIIFLFIAALPAFEGMSEPDVTRFTGPFHDVRCAKAGQSLKLENLTIEVVEYGPGWVRVRYQRDGQELDRYLNGNDLLDGFKPDGINTINEQYCFRDDDPPRRPPANP